VATFLSLVLILLLSLLPGRVELLPEDLPEDCPPGPSRTRGGEYVEEDDECHDPGFGGPDRSGGPDPDDERSGRP